MYKIFNYLFKNKIAIIKKNLEPIVFYIIFKIPGLQRSPCRLSIAKAEKNK